MMYMRVCVHFWLSFFFSYPGFFVFFFLLFFWFFVMGFSPDYIRLIISTGMVGVPKGTGNGFLRACACILTFRLVVL